MKRHLIAALSALALLSVGGAAVAQAPQPIPTLSATEKTAADSFIDALNGDAAARRAWLTANRAAAWPEAEAVRLLAAVAPPQGKLKTVRIERRRTYILVEVDMPQGRRARLDLALAAGDPGKVGGINAIPIPTPYPDKPAAAASRQGLTDMVAKRVAFATDRNEFSGAVLAMKGDEVIFQGAYGLADRNAGAPNTLQTRFHLGSMDKMFTALSIGQLIEQKKLTLDTRVIDVLPDYANQEAARKITIGHLLAHRAGLGWLWERKGYDRWKPHTTVTELLPAFAAETPGFEPGSKASYSNEGFLVLGAVIEKVSGMSWYDYVQKNVFDVAGMTHTGYPRIDEVAPDRAVGYRIGGAGLAEDGAYDDPLGYGPLRPNWDFVGYRGNACGGGYSTVGDMVAFLKALRAGKIVSPATLELLTAVQPQGIGMYGMGFQNRPAGEGRTLRGHDGGGPHSGINSDAKMVWETGYAYAVLGNYDAPFAQVLGGDIGAILAAQP